MHISKDSMFLKVMKCIEDRREDIIDLGESIFKSPETGFKETSTVKLVVDKFQSIGLSCSMFGDIPGVKITLDSGREGPGVAVLAELDAVICPEHPQSSAETGAVHACGHNCQIAAMFGAAAGILESGVKEGFTGISQYKPIFSSKRDYFDFIDSLYMKKSFQGQDLIK